MGFRAITTYVEICQLRNAQRSSREQHQQQEQQSNKFFGAARSKRKRPGRSRKKAQPAPKLAEVKSIMHRIFESQRELIHPAIDRHWLTVFGGKRRRSVGIVQRKRCNTIRLKGNIRRHCLFQSGNLESETHLCLAHA